jgi:hypothetical protein
MGAWHSVFRRRVHSKMLCTGRPKPLSADHKMAQNCDTERVKLRSDSRICCGRHDSMFFATRRRAVAHRWCRRQLSFLLICSPRPACPIRPNRSRRQHPQHNTRPRINRSAECVCCFSRQKRMMCRSSLDAGVAQRAPSVFAMAAEIARRDGVCSPLPAGWLRCMPNRPAASAELRLGSGVASRQLLPSVRAMLPSVRARP